MKTLGIDLSLTSTGMFLSSTNSTYKLIHTNKTKEERLIYISNEIIQFIHTNQPDQIGLEGLSFNSISASKDEIAANFWILRCELLKHFPNIKLNILQVTEWRDCLFTKEERKQWTQDKKALKELKDELKLIKDKKEKSKLREENEQLFLDANIKYLTWLKLPEPYKTKFQEIGFNNGCWDLTDAYFIAEHLRK